jgi:yeast amino acid transporter
VRLNTPKSADHSKGIFLTSGKILHDAGPGGAILSYTLTGTLIWSVIASLGEMTALMPVRSPITEYSSRYVDEAVGFAAGWMYWSVLRGFSTIWGPRMLIESLCRFSYVCSFAAQITASSSLIAFNYDNVIVWTFGERISPVLWIFLLLLYMTAINLLPVRVRTVVHRSRAQTTRIR